MRSIAILYCLFLCANSFAQAPSVLQWQKTYGGNAFDTAMDFKLLPDGSMVMLGSSKSNDGDISGNHGDPSTSDICLIKIDPAGNIVWKKNYGGTWGEGGAAISTTTDGGFIIVGTANSTDGDVTGNHALGTADIWVVKLDGFGRIIWQKCYGGTKDEYGGAIIETNGGYIVAGSVGSSDGDISGRHGNALNNTYRNI